MIGITVLLGQLRNAKEVSELAEKVEKVVSPKLLAMRALLYVTGLGALLIRRKDSGLWELPGGKVADNSIALDQEAAREFQEETGIPIYVGSNAVFYWDQRSTVERYKGMRYVCIIVLGFLRFPNYSRVTLSKEEHDKYCWVEPTPENIEQFREKHGGDIAQETIDALQRYFTGVIEAGRQMCESYDTVQAQDEEIAALRVENMGLGEQLLPTRAEWPGSPSGHED